MQTSIAITDFSWSDPLPIALRDVAAAVDASAIDSLFVSDHVIQAVPGTQPDDPWLEALTTLGALAAQTSRVRLGILVAAVTLRPPALLIKAVTTLDVLSGGRAWFGIGAGYLQAEADALGLPLPPTAERFEWLEDTLALARRMWAGNASAFHGTRLRADGPISRPPPVTRPHPPVLIGGTGETKTLRLVARYGDACNLFDIDDGGAEIRRKLGVLADHCTREGRPFDQIVKTVSTRLRPDDTAHSFVERARRLADSGADHLVVLTDGPWTVDRIGVLADAAEQVAAIPTASLDPHGDAMNDYDAFLDTWATAERDGDVATTERLLTDDFVGIGPVGYALPKTAWLQRHRNGLHYDRLDLDEIDTRHHGSTAITTARWRAHGTAQGHPIPETTRATLIATRDHGDWKLAGIHFSFIAGTPGAPGPIGQGAT